MTNFNSHGQELDGKGKIVPTPYDAHEQVVRGPHTHSLKDGYQKAEPKAEAPKSAPKQAANENGYQK